MFRMILTYGMRAHIYRAPWQVSHWPYVTTQLHLNWCVAYVTSVASTLTQHEIQEERMALVFLTRHFSAGGVCTAGQSRNYVASGGLLKEGLGVGAGVGAGVDLLFLAVSPRRRQRFLVSQIQDRLQPDQSLRIYNRPTSQQGHTFPVRALYFGGITY